LTIDSGMLNLATLAAKIKSFWWDSR